MAESPAPAGRVASIRVTHGYLVRKIVSQFSDEPPFSLIKRRYQATYCCITGGIPKARSLMWNCFSDHLGKAADEVKVCKYFIEFGDCKFGSQCKFRHPVKV